MDYKFWSTISIAMKKNNMKTDTTEETTKYFLNQWFTNDVAAKLKECSLLNAEFDVHYKEVEREGNLTKVQLTFRNCGRTIYHQRLVNFILKSTEFNN